MNFVAAMAARWARLRRKPDAEKRLALILSDYPAKGGRAGYAVGLDTQQSAGAILARLATEGLTSRPCRRRGSYRKAAIRPAAATVTLDVLSRLSGKACRRILSPRVNARWGEPEGDASVRDGAFVFRFLRLGKIIVALQPDRGSVENRKGDYHDAALPPRHAFLAFYLWLRESEDIDALIHCGAHGALEWLPGKSVALSEDCAPEIALGPVPLIYPFIVNNPGEAAQAKRRSGAVIVSHLSPPLVKAGAHGATAEIEALFDEYAQAQGLDPASRENARRSHPATRRSHRPVAGMRRAKRRGRADPARRLALRPQGNAHQRRAARVRPVAARRPARRNARRPIPRTNRASVGEKLDACGAAEMDALVHALRGGFVQPSPSGAPGRGRKDVLPTGRNLFAVDPRAIPTRTAWDIGQRLAQEVLDRYLQDHGEWPRRIVLDLWGSASMRTGGDDLAQGFALLGVRPLWDAASTRMSGYEILPLAQLGRPRVDVTLRISGLFRDVFPQQIEAFDSAVRAVAALDEPSEENPLAGEAEPRRIFGAAPGAYGVDLSGRLAVSDWRDRDELAQTYLAASDHAYGANGDPLAPVDRVVSPHACAAPTPSSMCRIWPARMC